MLVISRYSSLFYGSLLNAQQPYKSYDLLKNLSKLISKFLQKWAKKDKAELFIRKV